MKNNKKFTFIYSLTDYYQKSQECKHEINQISYQQFDNCAPNFNS